GGALKIDYTGSRGFNNFAGNPSLPPISPAAATISAQVFVPAQVTMQKLELGLQIDGSPGGAADILFHQLDVRGGWNQVAWSIHPGQVAGPGPHSLTFALSTDDPMP